MDTRLLKESFAAVADRGAELVSFFYADLFGRGGPEVAEMFPPIMAPQRDRLLGALVQVVTNVDDLDKLAAYLRKLGSDHRKYNVRPQHYQLVGKALMATLAHFAGDAWTPQVAETWAGAIALVAQVMQAGADADSGTPPWWDATVTSAEQAGPDVTVLTARLAEPMDYSPGQSVSVTCELVPRLWRFYSPACAPRGNRLIEFHVKAVPGGMLSTALAMRAGPGTRLRLGPPVGALTFDADSPRPVLLIAGSTGLAPLLAILEQLATRPSPPPARLYFGAHSPDGLYRLPELEKLAGDCEWLTLVTAVTEDPSWYPGYEGEHGSVVDVALRGGPWDDYDAYICGSSGMVQAAAARLMAAGVRPAHVHIEDFGWEG